MTIYNQPNLTAGFDEVLYSTSQSVPAFPIMILVFIFFTILLGGSSSQKRRTGSADIPMWAVLSSLSTTLVAIVMTLSPGMLQAGVLSIVVGITILFGIWFFLSKSRGEQ